MTKKRATTKHPAKIANHLPDRNRSKAVTAMSGPTLSAAASDGAPDHHRSPSGIKAQTQGIYQKLGAPKSNTRVKQPPPTVNSVPATIREMALEAIVCAT